MQNLSNHINEGKEGGCGGCQEKKHITAMCHFEFCEGMYMKPSLPFLLLFSSPVMERICPETRLAAQLRSSFFTSHHKVALDEEKVEKSGNADLYCKLSDYTQSLTHIFPVPRSSLIRSLLVVHFFSHWNLDDLMYFDLMYDAF